MEKRALKAEKQRDDALDKITQQRQEIYRLGIELEENRAPRWDIKGMDGKNILLQKQSYCQPRKKQKNAYVFVTAAPNGEVQYFARAKKGHEGVKGTPAEDYNGIIVQDHEKTFYKYGCAHQECLAHVERYLKDSAENEKDKTWSTEMSSLLKEMIHYRNGSLPGEGCSEGKINEFEEKYLKIINTAKEEYEYEPPGDYYKDIFYSCMITGCRLPIMKPKEI